MVDLVFIHYFLFTLSFILVLSVVLAFVDVPFLVKYTYICQSLENG